MAATRSLPVPLTRLVGRTREMAEVQRLVGTTRLLTLVGVGGVGKTRLALAVATAALPRYGDGARFVALAPVADGALVAQAVAAACGVREAPGRSIAVSLAESLRSVHLLLVLDSCDHLIQACAALVDTLLRACPQVSILATSREALGVAGETVWPVPPLSLAAPEPASAAAPAAAPVPPGPAAAGDSPPAAPAVELFLERTRAAAPGVTFARDELALVAELCRRLDGLPLAIELAAARTRALAIGELVRRLDDPFRLLTTGSRSSPPHQHTLRATMDWSHTLLDAPERVLFRRIAVFAAGSGFTLAAAEAVCADPEDGGATGEGAGGLLAQDVLDLLARLVDKSLVVVPARTTAADAEAPTRYALLETVRTYAAEKLREAGEEGSVQARHAAYYVALAEEAGPALTGPAQAVWMARLDAEQDNLRLVLGRVIDAGVAGDASALVGLRLGSALWRYWQSRGALSEGQRWLEAALARARDAPAPVRAAALTAAGSMALARGAPGDARRLHEDALAAWRRVGDRAGTTGTAAALRNLGLVAVDLGDRVAARERFEESLALERELADRWRIALTLHCLGALARDEGDLDRAQSLSGEALDLFSVAGDTRAASLVRLTLGSVALDRGDLELARTRGEESLEASRAGGDERGRGLALNHLAKVAFVAGETGAAASLAAESLSRAHARGMRRETTSGVEVLAAVAHRRGRSEIATRLFGAAMALRRASGSTPPPSEQRHYEGVLAATRAELGAEAFASTWRAGQGMSVDEAVTLALDAAGEDPAATRVP